MDLMSQADYARHRGVSRQAINKIVGSKIQLRTDPATGKKGIDPAEADLALGLNMQRVQADDDGDDRGQGTGKPQAPGLTSARTFEAVYKGRMAQLEYEQAIGKLRPIEQTELAAQACFEVVLRAISGIVGRAEDINTRSQKEGVAGVRASLREAVRDLRKVAAREFSKLADGEAVDAGAALEFEKADQ